MLKTSHGKAHHTPRKSTLQRKQKAPHHKRPHQVLPTPTTTPQKLNKRRFATDSTTTTNAPAKFDREQFDQLALRKMIYVPSFEIYGGVAGLYDYGPAGCAIMANVQKAWRSQFIQKESMMEVSCSALTPEAVLRTSGHLQKFTDWMVRTAETEQSIRADKLLEDFLETTIAKLKQVPEAKFTAEHQKRLNDALRDKQLAGSMDGEQLAEAIRRWEITVNGEALTEPEQFNLMFKTLIGPSGKSVAYLRPETAQGIFVNFKRLYDQNNRKLPFSVAQIGTSFRNEISPRGGLLRTREFVMAEIEHFVNPQEKADQRFNKIKTMSASFLSAEKQQSVGSDDQEKDQNAEEVDGDIMTFEDAVHNKKIVNNETLGFFLAKTHKFLTSIGVHSDKIRFRQHMNTEMAHYATDCWDAEILTSHGWVECVGHADRSAHDLTVHEAVTKCDLSATETLETPLKVTKYLVKPQKGKLVPFANKHPQLSPRDVITWVDGLDTEGLATLFNQVDGLIKQNYPQYPNGVADVPQKELSKLKVEFDVAVPLADQPDAAPIVMTMDSTMLQPAIVNETIHTQTFTPHVIEPSFGLGRIVYSLLEHAYHVRPDSEQRKTLRLPAHIAPWQLGIYTVAANFESDEIIEKISEKALDRGLSIQVDTSRASIGKKYSRYDEVGLPFVISVDANTGKDGTVTIRERDSCTQVLLETDKAVDVVDDLVRQRITWEQVRQTYTNVESGPEEKM